MKAKKIVCTLLAVIAIISTFQITASAVNPVEKMVTIADNYVGRTAASLGYTGGPWCAYFATRCAKEAGLSNQVPSTGSCETAIKNFLRRSSMYVAPYFLQNKSWRNGFSGLVQNATKITVSFTPRRGDFVFFADTPAGLVGHVGLVKSVSKQANGTVTITVIEGNWLDEVACNTYSFNIIDCEINSYWRYIVGFGRP